MLRALSLSGLTLLSVFAADNAMAAPRPDNPRLVVPRRTLETPVPKGTLKKPLPKLLFQLTCDAYMNAMIAYVALVNQGPGTVPVGTHAHYHMVLHPPPDREGDYVFEKKLAPGERVWMPYALPLNLNNGACTVTVQ